MLGMTPPAANRSTRSGRIPSAANRIADCSAGAATADRGLAGAGPAVASSAARTATTRGAGSGGGRRRASMGTFLKPTLDAGGEAEPGDAVTLPYWANRVKIPQTIPER